MKKITPKIRPKMQMTPENRKLYYAKKFEDVCLKEYGSDPLYKACIMADSVEEQDKAFESLKKLRGESAYHAFMEWCKRQWMIISNQPIVGTNR